MIATLKNLAIAALAFIPVAIDANPYVIADERVRSLDITPVLGRGYSVMTNSFQSTCLEVDEITIPSFNYDYGLYDFTGSTDFIASLQNSLAGTFAYDGIKREFDTVYDPEQTATVKVFYIISTMRIERYYASVKDESSRITADAISLLDGQDYIGFFKACGPSYVRGIRRAQEVTASFKFTSNSAEAAQNFGAGLSQSDDGRANIPDPAINQSLEIKVKGYGLALDQAGGETLLATSLAEFNGIMKFAFHTMTSHPEAHHIGMVQGMEVVPWTENVKFQVAAAVGDEVVEIPIPRSLMTRAYEILDVTNFDFAGADVDTRRALFRCKNLGHSIDRYGYCCELGAMYDFAGEEYNPDSLDERVCRPIRNLDKTIVKENLASNGEFIARLDQTLRYKMNKLSKLQMCVSSINGYPEYLDGNYLVSHSSSLSAESVQLTVFDMKQSLDPFGDMGMVKQLGKELDEFIQMFYAPCLNALFGGKSGSEPSAANLMAYPWYTYTECGYMSCLADGMRWDRNNGGCIPGMAAGPEAESYASTSATPQCAMDTESGGATETCKDSTADLEAYQTLMNACWTLLGTSSIETYLQNYCMPKVSAEKMTQAEIDARKLAATCTSAAGTTPVTTSAAPMDRRLSSIERANKFKKEQLNSRRRMIAAAESKRRTEEKAMRRTEEKVSYGDDVSV